MTPRETVTLSGCRNPNGTWNGAKTIALITGRTEKQVRAIWSRMSFLNTDCNMNIKDAAAIAVKEHEKGA